MDIAKQIGEYYKSQNIKLPDISIDQKLYKNQLKIYQKYYPELIQELEQIATVAGFGKDVFVYMNVASFIDFHKNLTEPKKGCTIFGIKNKSGAYVGRNYDWRPGALDYFSVSLRNYSDRNKFIGISDMDYGNRMSALHNELYYANEDAINEYGLYIGLTFAYSNGLTHGISPISMIQLIAETCKTTADALEIFAKVPLGVPKNFFIADAGGDMAVVEHVAAKHKIIRPVNDILVHTNHFIDPELTSSDLVLKHDPHSTTYRRYAESLEQLTQHKEKVHQIGVEKILRRPDLRIYEHNNKMTTIWSLAIDLSTRIYRLYSTNHAGQTTEHHLELS